MVQTVLRGVSTALSIYMLLIFFRIILTWFGQAPAGRLIHLISRATDPYLNLFRGIGALRTVQVDFSPVLALITLSILNNIITRIAFVGQITLGVVLAEVVGALWSAASFILFLFLLFGLIRLAGFLFNVNTAGRFWITLDRLLQPIAYWLVQKIARGRSTNYQNALLLYGGVILLVLLLGSFVISSLVALLAQLPV